MNCPKCGLINPNTAERCDCGFSFLDGSFVAPSRMAPPGEKLRRVGCALGVVGMLASVLLRKIPAGQESVRLAAGALGDLLILVAFIGLAVWIIGTLRKRRARA